MKTIFIIFGVYILWRIGSRVWQLRKIIKQHQQPFQGQNHPPKKEGEINVISKPQSDSQKSDNGGEYVDYEEL